MSVIPPLLLVHASFQGPRDLKTVPMVIDTGATSTIIPPQVALAIGCDPSKSKKRVGIITASGLEYLPIVTIPEMVCLDIHVRALEVVCHDLPPQSTAEGLLGLDFLRHVPAFQEFERRIREIIHP